MPGIEEILLLDISSKLPVNYTLLHEDEQISIVEGFKELLNQIRRDIVIV